MTSMPTDPLTDPRPSPPPARRALPYVVAAVLLAGAIGLTARTVAQAWHSADVLAPPALPAVADPADRARRLHDVIGTFATGTEPGNRVMEIQPNGRVRFYLIGALREALESSDTYQLALRDGHTVLVTPHSGTIDAVDIDHLSYWDDVYARTK